jgi:hypothetical protein
MRKNGSPAIKLKKSNHQKKQISFINEPWYKTSFQAVAVSSCNARSNLVDHGETIRIEEMIRKSRISQRN